MRPELGERSTILGFCGISPDVTVSVSAIPGHINFAAIFLCAPATESGQIEIDLILDGPNGVQLAKADGSTLEAEVGKPVTCAFNFQGLPVTEAGIYTLRLFSEGRAHSAHTFEIAHAVG